MQQGCGDEVRLLTDTFAALIDKLESWLDSFVLLLPNLVGALLAVAISVALGRLLGGFVYRGLERVSANQALNSFARKLTRFLGVVVGLVVALQILGLGKAATTFLAGAGLIGLALGFALQDLSANFIAGVAMAFKRPIEVGDLVETNDRVGLVERIELRSTVLRSPDGRLVRMPNRKIFEEAIINHSTTGNRRVEIAVGVSYSADLEEVDRATRAAIEQVADRDSSRDIEVYFKEFGDSSINLVARFWIPFARNVDYLRAQNQAVRAIKKTYDARGIVIPFPIRTLDPGDRFEEMFGEQLATAARSSGS